MSLADILARHKGREGPLLPILHDVQAEFGHVSEDGIRTIASDLNLTRAEVHGVITYYHFFRSTPAGRHVVQVCQAEACQACGANELMAFAEETLGCRSHQTTPNGAVTLEPVYCLGLCASSPAVQVNDKLYARVSTNQLKILLAPLESAT